MRLSEVTPQYQKEADLVVKQGADKRFRQLALDLASEFDDAKFRQNIPGWSYHLTTEVAPGARLKLSTELGGKAGRGMAIETDPKVYLAVELSVDKSVPNEGQELANRLDRALSRWRVTDQKWHRGNTGITYTAKAHEHL